MKPFVLRTVLIPKKKLYEELKRKFPSVIVSETTVNSLRDGEEKEFSVVPYATVKGKGMSFMKECVVKDQAYPFCDFVHSLFNVLKGSSASTPFGPFLFLKDVLSSLFGDRVSILDVVLFPIVFPVVDEVPCSCVVPALCNFLEESEFKTDKGIAEPEFPSFLFGYGCGKEEWITVSVAYLKIDLIIYPKGGDFNTRIEKAKERIGKKHGVFLDIDLQKINGSLVVFVYSLL